MPENATAGIEVSGLSKTYGDVAAVREVSFSVKPGEVFGLLGPNGAGKTTVLECVLGLRRPDSGTLRVAGRDVVAAPGAAKGCVGAVLQGAALQDGARPGEILRLFASFSPQGPSWRELAARFGLEAVLDRSFAQLSGGLRQRLFLALAFVNDPAVVVLDEPTAGLDPEARRDLRLLVQGLAENGRAVLLSTHDLEEAQSLCRRVGILHRGRLLACGTPQELAGGRSACSVVELRCLPALDAQRVCAWAGVVSAQAIEGGWRIVTRDSVQTVQAAMETLKESERTLVGLSTAGPSLEEAFMHLVGDRKEDGAP